MFDRLRDIDRIELDPDRGSESFRVCGGGADGAAMKATAVCIRRSPKQIYVLDGLGETHEAVRWEMIWSAKAVLICGLMAMTINMWA